MPFMVIESCHICFSFEGLVETNRVRFYARAPPTYLGVSPRSGCLTAERLFGKATMIHLSYRSQAKSK